MNTHNRNFILILCVLAALVAAIVATLFGEPAEKWLGMSIVNGVSSQAWFESIKPESF